MDGFFLGQLELAFQLIDECSHGWYQWIEIKHLSTEWNDMDMSLSLNFCFSLVLYEYTQLNWIYDWITINDN